MDKGPVGDWMSRCSVLALGIVLVAVSGCATPFVPRKAKDAEARAMRSPAFEYLLARQLEGEGRGEEALDLYLQVLSQDPDSSFLLLRVAQLAAELDRLDEARSYAERAYALDPGDLDARLLLGRLRQHAHDFAAAEKLYRDDENGEPINVQAAMGLFNIEMEQKRYEDALVTAQWLMRKDPESLHTYFELAAAYARLERFEEAKKALREGLKLSKGNLAIYSQLAELCRLQGDREGEIAVYREVLAIYPHHHGTLRELVNVQVDLDRLDDAMATLGEIIEFYPEDVNSRLRRALIDYQRDNFDAAEKELADLVAEDPSSYELQFFRGVLLRKLDRLDEAIAAFQSVPAEHSRYLDAHTQIASIYETRGDFDLAIEELQRVREKHPSASLDLYLAGLMAKAGHMDEAITFVEQIRKAEPANEEVIYNLGVLQGEAGRQERSLETMREVLAINPNHAGALNYIGYSWAERGQRLQEAEAMISRALTVRPNDGYITDSLGWVYYMQGMAITSSDRSQERILLLRRSIVELEKAAQLTGGDPIIFEHLGDAYLALDEKKPALENYREALKSNADSGNEASLRIKIERLERELEAP